MDDLFEQLKKAPAVNKNIKAPPSRKFKSPPPSDDLESNALGRSPTRRESMPSTSSSSIFKKLNSHKSRSLSPPKHYIRPLKVLIERKKLEDVMKVNKGKQKKSTKSASKTIADAYRELFKLPTNQGKTVKSPTKTDKSTKERKSDKVDKSPTKTEKPINADKSNKSPTKTEKVDKSIKSPNNAGKPIKVHTKSPPKAEKTGKADKTLKVDKIGDKTTPSKKALLSNSSSSNNGSSNSTPIKVTPTKAQQKQFAPCDTVPPYGTLNMQEPHNKKNQLHKIKRCVVRLQRQNLKKLQKKMLKLNSKNGKITGREAIKRKSSDKNSPSPTKRAKESNKKESTGFFIKLSTPSTLKVQNKKQMTKKTDFKNRVHSNHKSNKLGLSFTNYKSSSSSSTTKPTKFTRTQLIKAFGKRFFKAHVKIEKCNHPLMLIFESNARARKLQTKRNKSKNLSVSFKEQVEIFGCTDSEDYDSSDSDSDIEYRPKGTSARKMSLSFNAATNKSGNSSTALTPLPATPARLKKVENGKVVDDIELDPALFLDPSVVASGTGASSTPYGLSPGRKKREKKSFSPLKNEATSSPRKEQFKLANEKMPPSGLRRLNIDDVDDEDDEDDDCEYIVPIDIPQRRTSRANSNNGAESSSSFQSALEDPSSNLAASNTAIDKAKEVEAADAPTPEDLRLDAPTPDNLELDAPTPEGIDTAGAEDNISNRLSVTENKKDGAAEKNAVKKADAIKDDIAIFTTTIANDYTPITAMLVNDTAESMPALEMSGESGDGQSLDGENEESNIDARNQDEDVDEQSKQLKENAAIATTTNGNNGENGSVAADGSNAAHEQDISLTMFVEDTQGEEDLIENILKERIDEIVKEVEMNDSSKESNNLEILTKNTTSPPSNATAEE